METEWLTAIEAAQYLKVKARAGCTVTLVVPAKSNHPVTDFARRTYTRELINAGGHMVVYNDGMLHGKAMVIDDRVALVGPPNFALRSLFVNFEIGVLVYTAPEVAAIKAWVAGLIGECTPPPEQRRHFLTSVAEDLCRLLAPLLSGEGAVDESRYSTASRRA